MDKNEIALAMAHKANAKMLDAVGMYNDPRQEYRLENLCEHLDGAWELLLKARLVSLGIKNVEEATKLNLTRQILKNAERIKAIGLAPGGQCVTVISFVRKLRNSICHGGWQIPPVQEKAVLETAYASVANYVLATNRWFATSLRPVTLLPISLDTLNAVASAPNVVIGDLIEQFADAVIEGDTDDGMVLRVKVDYALTPDSGVKLTSDSSAPAVRLDILKDYPYTQGNGQKDKQDLSTLLGKLAERYEGFPREGLQDTQILRATVKEVKDMKDDKRRSRYYAWWPANPGRPQGNGQGRFSDALLEKLYARLDGEEVLL